MKKAINYSKLVVNPENYRFDPVDSQEEAIDLMINQKGKEIFNLAKHIVENGLDPAKDFRVREVDKNNYIVLDGNRRATALKCLHNPSLIKDAKLRKSFESLSLGKTIQSEVSSYVYLTEEDAAKWIKLDHTGKNDGAGQDSWGSAEVDRFGYRFEGKISPAMQIVDMVEKETGNKIDTSKLKVSTINRILSNPESRSILGIDVKKGLVETVLPQEEVVANSQKLFDKVIKEDVKVDEVYNKEKSINFMLALFGKESDQKEPVAEEAEPKESEPPTEEIITPKKSSPKTTSRMHLIPNSCVIEIDNRQAPKINNIYRELKNDLLLDDSPQAVPNAVGVLFRVFLEISLDYYTLKKEAYTFKRNDSINTKVARVVSTMTSKGYDAKIFTEIKKVGSASTSASYLSIENFHEYVHSSRVQATPSDLKLKWDNLQSFFEALWASIKKGD